MNNCSRTTLQALAAVLGGTQSLHVNAYDEALGLPSEAGVEFALRAQQIIAYESGVCDTIDPLAGSYAVESLTDSVESEALEVMDLVDRNGGAVEAASSGYTAAQIGESAYQAQNAIESDEQVVVGLNRFSTSGDPVASSFTSPGDAESQQKKLLADMKRGRDNEAVRNVLDVLQNRASGSGPITETIVEACSVGSTLGEITDALRKVFGSHSTMEGNS
jgi:methylmalonyl-CoA mutase N-terminal domain/subunit